MGLSYRGDTQGTELPRFARLGDELSAAWARHISACPQLASQPVQVGVLADVSADAAHGLPVDACRALALIGSYTRPGAPQVARVDDPVPQLAVTLVEVLPTPLIQLALHAQEPGLVGLGIRVHGSFLRLRLPIDSLLAFAMWPAFPSSDYYASSAPGRPPPRSPRVARVRHGRGCSGSHVPIANLQVHRWRALPLVAPDDGRGRNPVVECDMSHPSAVNIKHGRIAPRSPSLPTVGSCKYRGFQRTLRCLTIDLVVARRADPATLARYSSGRSAHDTRPSANGQALRPPFARPPPVRGSIFSCRSAISQLRFADVHPPVLVVVANRAFMAH